MSHLTPVAENATATITALDPERLAHAKAAYTTRRVPLGTAAGLLAGESVVPRAGDVVLARVSELGQHPKLEQPDGRRASLFPGDEVIVCYANRYAPDQFEATVPGDLGECDLAAAGGVAAQVVSRHSHMSEPTRLQPLGLLVDLRGHRLALGDWALPAPQAPARRVPTVAGLGTAMNAGKTTTVASLVRGLRAAGRRVGTAKVTGTGAGGDRWLMIDAGAQPALDFTSAGLASTYLAPASDLEVALELLHGHVAAEGVDVVVLEVADGLYHGETAELICTKGFRALVDGVVFAAGDALGAATGVSWLGERGLPVIALSGLMTASPLAIREARAHVDLPVHSAQALASAEIAEAVLEGLGVPVLAQAA